MAAWYHVRHRPFWTLLLVIRSYVTIALLLFSTLYIGYYESEKTSGELSKDFSMLAAQQKPLLDHTIELTSKLVDKSQKVDLDQDISKTNELARNTLAALGQFRAPSSAISDARNEYQRSLEVLIGVTARLQRGETNGMGALLHNSLQKTTNYAGEFRVEVEEFQGSAWRRTWRSIL